jgi:hypothetical protein
MSGWAEVKGMRHRALFVTILGAATMTNLTRARAAETAAVAVASAPSKMRVTALFVPAPAGILHSAIPGDDVTVGSQPAFGVATAFDFVAHPNVFVGFGAGYTFNVVARGTTAEAGTAFDLTLRVGGSVPITHRMAAYGYLAPGYSFMHGVPGALSPQGPVVGVHAGALFDLTPAWFLAAELGYQAGFQRASVNGMDVAYDASFFQTGIGLGVRI